MITSTNVIDYILDSAYALPTGITVESIEEPGGSRGGDYRATLLDSIGGARQTVRIDPHATESTIGRLLRDAATQLTGRKPVKSRRKKAIK